jgi:hypothetical protein
MNAMIPRNDGLELTKHGLSVVAQKQREALITALGGAATLSAIDIIKLDQAVRLLQRSRRGTTAEDMVRLSNAAQKLIDQLQARKAKRRPPAPPVEEMMARMVAR